MLEDLKIKVCQANLELARKGIVIYTWGNVSEITEDRKYVVIKPSGVDYDIMKPEDMVIVELQTGNLVEGKWKPSTDTATHLELYKAFDDIKGVCHTHSINACAFAQAGIDLPALGTTHADYFYGSVPCTRPLTKEEVTENYEQSTGKVIVETFIQKNIKAKEIPSVIVNGHGPFSWGKDANEAVYHAVVLETIAEMTLKTNILNPNARLPAYVLDKHYQRKHGKNAYYGQK